MTTRALVALAIAIAAVIVAVYVLASVQRPLAAATPMVWVPVPEEEFSRLDAGNSITNSHSPVVISQSPTPKSKATPKPTPRDTPMTNHVAGLATWYDDGPGLYAAAGPALRRAIGPGWRDTILTVCSGPRCVDGVRLGDWCACRDRHGQHTVLDLSLYTFARIGPAPRGVIEVIVSWR